MGVIRFPHDVVDPDLVTQLHTRKFKPEIHIDLPAEHLAGPCENPFGPKVTSLPLVIAAFQNKIEPTHPCFGTHPFEARVTIHPA